MYPIILASSSKYRRQLLDQLQLKYESISPDIDETLKPAESAQQAALRLAKDKAMKVAESNPKALIIGSDQTAELEGRILGKPHSIDNAVKQLCFCSGNTVRFWTGLALFNGVTKNLQSTVVPFDVTFRQLSTQQIMNYIDKEQPLDCAGSFKVEGLGISLFEKLSGNDPNALIGLPLIQLVSFLDVEGVSIL